MPVINMFSGAYRDATRGATLKALEERRKSLEDALTKASQPTQVNHPLQGLAGLAETVSTGIREGRAANDEMAGRQRLAEIMAGGVDPSELGSLYTLAPDIAATQQSHLWDVEKARTERDQTLVDDLRKHGWDVDAAVARVRADREAAAEAARVAAEQQKEQQRAASELSAQGARQTTTENVRKEGLPEQGSVQAIIDAGKRGQFGDLSVPANKAVYDAAINKATYIAPTNIASTYTPGEQAEEQDFAKQKASWENTGLPAYAAQKANINKALSILDQDKGSGGWAGFLNTVVSSLPESAQPAGGWLETLVSPSATTVSSAMKTAVQENLKTVLGSQFAAIEGSQMMERAFDPRQDPAENARRARIIMQRADNIASLMDSKIKYYNEHGHSIRGWNDTDLQQQIKDLASLDFGGGGGGGGAGAGAGANNNTPNLSNMTDQQIADEIARLKAQQGR